MDRLEAQLRSMLDRAHVLHHREQDLISEAGRADGHGFWSPELVGRIVRAFNRSPGFAAGSSMWSAFINKNADLTDALLSGDADVVAKLLSRPSEGYQFTGFDNTTRSLADAISENPGIAQWLAMEAYDALLRLTEALGLRRLANPEQYAYKESSPVPVDELLNDLSQSGILIDFPNPYPGEWGLKTERGIISLRAVHGLYQALMLKELGFGKVLELGAGLGRGAYYASRLGIDYTVVDLPTTGIAQAHFLSATLGEDAISLVGESPNGVRILPPSALLDGDETYDAVLNVDSFTEMDAGFADSYWNAIRRSANVFLSINHEENQSTIRSYVQRDGDSIASASRHPAWMRVGYVEEMIRFSSTAT